ncbi:MAG: hypothetical protein DMF76_19370 [Acidobacteria bacterium]|nr:MAG: hypothetical protein DMF76_19370 [Acidobacteriota bacterium]
MFERNSLKRLSLFLIGMALLLSASIQGQQSKKSHPKPIPNDAKPVLWREPTDIASRDLFLGPGGEAMKPDLSKVTFIADETRSYSKKYRVRDGAGNEWVVKLGTEAQSETAATRLLWAAGYFVDITYLAPHVDIEGKGSFDNARFEARPKGQKRLGQRWDWSKNPFVGTNELQGLKVLMALINNWDIQNHNNNILLITDEATGEKEARYFDTDLGASFGKEGRFIGHTRNRPDQYVADTKFITGVEHGLIRFDYKGKNKHLIQDITVAQAKWLGNILSQLSDQQITDAFRAANYSPEQIEALTRVVKARISELVNLQG